MHNSLITKTKRKMNRKRDSEENELTLVKTGVRRANKQHNTSYSTMGGSNANLLEEVRATKRDITTAHTTFTTHFNTFLSLAEQLEIRLKEVEGREVEVEKKENKLKGADQQYEERERKSHAREKEVEERERSVVEKETRWKETEKRMEANAAKLPTIIKLNISMTIITLLFILALSLHPRLSL